MWHIGIFANIKPLKEMIHIFLNNIKNLYHFSRFKLGIEEGQEL
jgi:hypothetical protein